MIRYEHTSWESLWKPYWHAMESAGADLIICDPIYSDLDLDYLPVMAMMLRPGGSLYIFSDKSGVADVVMKARELHDLELQNWLIWGPNDWGGRSKQRWGQKHDDILFFTKKGAPHYFNGDAVAVPKKMTQPVFNPSGRTTKIPHSVWDDLGGFSTMSSERVKIDGHAVPWQKPERVIERIILASSRAADLIIDPFGGVATVPAVCQRLDRRCVSTEIDFQIYQAGRKRFEESLDKSPYKGVRLALSTCELHENLFPQPSDLSPSRD